MAFTILVLGTTVLVADIVARCLTSAVLHFAHLDVTERLEDNAPMPN
jgi:hypothetical protein